MILKFWLHEEKQLNISYLIFSIFFFSGIQITFPWKEKAF